MMSPQRKLIQELVDNNKFYDALGFNRTLKLPPGQAILSLSQEKRGILAKLKPEDVQNVRWPWYR